MPSFASRRYEEAGKMVEGNQFVVRKLISVANPSVMLRMLTRRMPIGRRKLLTILKELLKQQQFWTEHTPRLSPLPGLGSPGLEESCTVLPILLNIITISCSEEEQEFTALDLQMSRVEAIHVVCYGLPSLHRLVDTAVKTSRSGYLQRCLIKNLECLKVCYDYTVRDADGSIIQFHYGEDGVDVHQTSFLNKFESLAANREVIDQKFYHQLDFNTYIEELPDELLNKVKKYTKKLEGKQIYLEQEQQEDLLKLMKQKYLLSLAQSGEPVGVIAAQSVGEPSTQMTLNTFHLAGRGDVNVTLGIPRLQEILMTASNDNKTPIMTCPLLKGRTKKGSQSAAIDELSLCQPAANNGSSLLNTFHLAGRGDVNVTLGIPRLQEILMTASNDNKTPIMTCPLLKGRTKDDARELVAKVKKVTVADIIETVEVRVLPFSIENNQTSSIYKLTVKFKEHDLVSIKDCKRTLKVVFLRELEDAIESHLILLSKIRDIKNFMPSSQSKASDETGEDASGSRSQGGNENDDVDDDDDDDERAEDLGSDSLKRKQQAMDEMDYDDGSEDELNEEEPLAEPLKGIDHGEDEVEIREDGEIEDFDGKGEAYEMPYEHGEAISELESGDRKDKKKAKRKQKVREKFVGKESDRAIFVSARGLHFEVHFRFNNEPHILLAQVLMNSIVCLSFYYGHHHHFFNRLEFFIFF
ncbi:unnamed protein product [Ilex paraguariensis]|uniref:DNA-directed RNA polymerase n=1 Tax=Ilex paraguariensis TaxID=185542 RepID=A0ABC8SJ29_9AQUA